MMATKEVIINEMKFLNSNNTKILEDIRTGTPVTRVSSHCASPVLLTAPKFSEEIRNR